MADLCKIHIPEYIESSLSLIKDNDESVKNYGIQLVIQMCEKLKRNGINRFHFYTLNLERSTGLILEGLGIKRTSTSSIDHPNSVLKKQKENRKLWRNRSTMGKTTAYTWDEFVNGRWGDSRSPAYGNIDGYGVSFNLTLQKAESIWGSPISNQDLCHIFSSYIKGEITQLPWCQYPLDPETKNIEDRLLSINLLGFWTIDSQPAVDAFPSAHEIYGWGMIERFVTNHTL
jgi:methylenetetrahydrofolate reductase (NADPH)